MTEDEKRDFTPSGKISEKLLEMAAKFIQFGKTPEEKHNRLLAVCSAWNMSSSEPELRARQLDAYVEGYGRLNAANSPSDLAKIRTDMESLMARKLQLFADDRRQIIDARVVMVQSGFRIEVEARHDIPNRQS